jgi:ATP-dependent helicase HrpA
VVPERATLYGLPVVHQRTTDVGRLDPALAREMFVRHALVEGDWPAAGPVAVVLDRNRRLVAALEALEQRARGRRQLVADDALFAFYDRHLGPDVTSGRRFEQWWKQARAAHADLLTLTAGDALRPGTGAAGLRDYPDRWHQGDLALPVTYRFEPGEAFDGVTVHIPVAVLDQVRVDGFDWQVPGMRDELAEALARSLPKPVRRHLVPVADAARRVLATLDPGGGRLIDGLAAGLGREAGLPITAGDLRVEDLPDHLRITFSVDDEQGRPLAHGKDLGALQARLRPRTRAAIARAAPTAERTGLTAWGDLGELPREVASISGGHTVRAYPALVDEGATVGVRVLTSPAAQARAMHGGTRRLLQLTVASPRKAMERAVTNDVKLALARLGRGSVADLLDECVAATIDVLVTEHGGPAWDVDAFASLAGAVRDGLVDRAPAVVADATRAVVAAAAVQSRLAGLTTPALQPAVADARSQVSRLVGPGALLAAGVDRLGDLRRYLRGLERRLERLPADPGRDRKAMAVVHTLEDAYATALAAVAPDRRDARHDDVLWTLEELRVSLFAQNVGTARPVSEQRVRREIDALRDP